MEGGRGVVPHGRREGRMREPGERSLLLRAMLVCRRGSREGRPSVRWIVFAILVVWERPSARARLFMVSRGWNRYCKILQLISWGRGIELPYETAAGAEFNST